MINLSKIIPKKDLNRSMSPQLLFYLMYICYSLVYRTYSTASILNLANISSNSISIVAVSGFLSSMFSFISSGFVGTWVDKSNRLDAMRKILSILVCTVSCEFLLSAYILSLRAQKLDTHPEFYIILPLLAATSNLAMSICSMTIERDWVVVISCGDSSFLSKINSNLSQIDLCCNTIVPAVVGYLFTSYGDQISLVLYGLSLWNFLTVFGTYSLLKSIYIKFPILAEKMIEVKDEKNKSVVTIAENSCYSMSGNFLEFVVGFEVSSFVLSCLLSQSYFFRFRATFFCRHYFVNLRVYELWVLFRDDISFSAVPKCVAGIYEM